MEFVNHPSHKAVVVLDKGPKFARFAEIELQVSYKDANSKPKKAGFSPKTLWNCSLDSAVEFQRVLTDVFPNGSHCVRYLVVEATKQFIFESWHPIALEEDEFIQAFYEAGCTAANPELDQSSCSIMSGVEAAIDACTVPSPHQKRYSETLSPLTDIPPHNLTDGIQLARAHCEVEPGIPVESQYVDNVCTIFVITSFDGDNVADGLKQLADSTQQYLDSKNRIIKEMESKDDVLLVGGLRVYVLNIVEDDSGIAPSMTNNPSFDVRITVYNITPKKLNSYLHRVMLEAYDLASTTITGIPMKEETQPTKSLDYDVEVFHGRELHDQLYLNHVLEHSSIRKQLDCGYETICLKWCNPVQKLRKDAFAVRDCSDYCTPVDILSRPTMCVVGFLKKGKHIWLEVPEFNEKELKPNMAGKLVTHVLSFDVQRSGMTIAAMAFGQNYATYEQQLEQAVACLGTDEYDQCESVMLQLSADQLEKLDAATEVEIVRREEVTYVDDVDPMFGQFPLNQPEVIEAKVFKSHDDLVAKMKTDYNVVYHRFGFEPNATSLCGSNEFLAIQNTVKGPLKPCDDAVRAWMKYIIDELLTEEDRFRRCFPRNYCMMYQVLLLLQKHQPGLFHQYIDQVCKSWDDYGSRYHVHELMQPPLPPKRKATDELNYTPRLFPYCFTCPESKLELYKHSVLINHPLPITTGKQGDKEKDEGQENIKKEEEPMEGIEANDEIEEGEDAEMV